MPYYALILSSSFLPPCQRKIPLGLLLGTPSIRVHKFITNHGGLVEILNQLAAGQYERTLRSSGIRQIAYTGA